MYRIRAPGGGVVAIRPKELHALPDPVYIPISGLPMSRRREHRAPRSLHRGRV